MAAVDLALTVWILISTQAIEEKEESEHGDLSQETLQLPGHGSEHEDEPSAAAPGGDASNDGEDAPAAPVPSSSAAKCNQSLHTVYWAVVHENQKRLKFPHKTGKEILTMAKKECFVSKSYPR